jgi:hypothetical protein
MSCQVIDVRTLGMILRAGSSFVGFRGVLGAADYRRDDRCERCLHDGPGGGCAWFATVDMEDMEDGAVEQLAGFGSAAQVELSNVLKQVENLLKALVDDVAGGLRVVVEPFGIGDLSADSLADQAGRSTSNVDMFRSTVQPDMQMIQNSAERR